MTNLPALTNSLTIQTVDGQTIDLANFNPLDVVTPSSSGKPLYRLTAGQPRDQRYPEASNKLFLTRKLREDGQTRVDNVGPFEEITVYPLQVWANRSYMPKYVENSNSSDANKPLCHSESFITPDALYMGTYSNQCCAFDPKTNRVVPVCPLAKWGEKDSNGQSTPPVCSESYILFAAITLETEAGPQAEVIEIYFSRSSATNGKNLTQKLRAMQQQGVAIWEFPIRITVKPVKIGNTVEGTFIQRVEMDQADTEGMIAMSNRAEEAISYRKERASRLPEAQGENSGDEIPFDTVPAQQASQPSKPTQPSQAAALKAAAPTNGTKKKSLI